MRVRTLLLIAGLLISVHAEAKDGEDVPFACAIQPDGQTVSVTIKNPFDRETSCQVNCQISTAQAGTEFQISCTNNVQPGEEKEICRQVYEKGGLGKMRGGDGTCIRQKPLAEEEKEEQKSDEDDDATIQKMMKEGQDFIEKNRQK